MTFSFFISKTNLMVKFFEFCEFLFFSFKDDSVRRSLGLIIEFLVSTNSLIFIVKPTSPLEESRLRTVELSVSADSFLLWIYNYHSYVLSRPTRAWGVTFFLCSEKKR